MFISEAFAQASEAAASTSGSLQSTFIQIGLIFLIFYVVLLRPQQKKFKQHEALLDSIKKGDQVLTGGGIYGKVVKADGMELVVEIADGINVTVNRGTIRDVVSDLPVKPAKADSKPANSNKKEKAKK